MEKTVQALDAKVPVPVVAITIALGMSLVFHVESVSGPIEHLRNVATTVTSQLSGCIAIAAFGAFWKARTTIDPFNPERATALVTSGFYRFTRNPMYLSLLLLLLAYVIHLCSLIALVGPIAFVAYTTWFQIIPEERALESKFGDQYSAYKRKVRRWL